MKLPRLISVTKAPHPIKRLPIGTQAMLDEARAKEVAKLHQRIANLRKKIQLIQQVDSAALNASALPDLEMQLVIARIALEDVLSSYSANSEVSNGQT